MLQPGGQVWASPVGRATSAGGTVVRVLCHHHRRPDAYGMAAYVLPCSWNPDEELIFFIKKGHVSSGINTLCHKGSDSQAEDAHDGVHGLVLPSDRAASVCVVVPETRACGVQACTRLLQHDDRDDVLERLVERGQPLEALLHDVRGPLVHLVVLVHVDSDGCGWVGGEDDRT